MADMLGASQTSTALHITDHPCPQFSLKPSVSIVCVLTTVTLCVNWFLLNLSSKGGSSDVLYIVMLNMLLNTTMATQILEQKVSTLETDNAFYKQHIRLLQQSQIL
jgi:ammonia channel protein AmtB